jgi:cyclic-di-GMP phosphodiesterase TipF (flagellum assembly factor)
MLVGAALGLVAGLATHFAIRATLGPGFMVLAGDIILSIIAGMSLSLFALFLISEQERKKDIELGTKRYSHMLARLNAAEIELTQMKSRLEETRSSYEVKAAQRNQRLVDEMKMIEGLVQQLAARPTPTTDLPGPQRFSKEALVARAAALAEQDEPTAKPVAELSEAELLEVIQSALEDNRIDLYLRPIVSLPQRKVAHYEGLARLRSLDGELIEPSQYQAVAGAAGLMPVIDNLLLFRCVQIVRRLSAKSNKRSILARISSHSLLDSDFFPQFLEFMTENRALKELLVFELPHTTLDLAGNEGETNLGALASLGFSFALSEVSDLRLDLGWLRRQNFRYVKMSAGVFGALGADPTHDIAVDNFLARLARQKLELIAGDIAEESVAVDVVERNVRWGEGSLFGTARPIRRELLAGDGRSAA